MTAYEVTSLFITINGGIVQLTDDQARRRKHLIEGVKDKKNMYRVKTPIQFKKGEIFAFDGEVNKMLLKELEEVGKVELKNQEKPKRGRPPRNNGS